MTLQTTPRTSDNHLLKVADTISPHEHLQKKLKRRRDVVLNEARMTVEMQDSPQGCLTICIPWIRYCPIRSEVEQINNIIA